MKQIVLCIFFSVLLAAPIKAAAQESEHYPALAGYFRDAAQKCSEIFSPNDKRCVMLAKIQQELVAQPANLGSHWKMTVTFLPRSADLPEGGFYCHFQNPLFGPKVASGFSYVPASWDSNGRAVGYARRIVEIIQMRANERR